MKGYDAALEQARIGLAEGGLPIGACLADGEEVLGVGHNRRVQHDDPTAHAEIDCLRSAGARRTYRGLTLYTTLTPCFLCSGAIVLFGIEEVVIGDSVSYDGRGSTDLLREKGVRLEHLGDERARLLLEEFIEQNPETWHRDIGEG